MRPVAGRQQAGNSAATGGLAPGRRSCTLRSLAQGSLLAWTSASSVRSRSSTKAAWSRSGGASSARCSALLLLHANETLSTDRLIDELWGEHPPATAAKTVQVHVSRLRKALGPAGRRELVTREHGYELALDPERLDAHSVRAARRRGTRRRWPRATRERAASALEEALSLWRGRPLDDLAYEPFAQREIARLEDLRVGALEQLIEAKLALGRHAEVVGQLEALIDDHPVPGAPARAADARALPLRPPGRRAAGLPGRAAARWSRSSESSRASACASSSGRSSRRTRRSRRRRPSRRAAGGARAPPSCRAAAPAAPAARAARAGS